MKFALVYQYDPATDSPTEAEIPDWLSIDQEIKDSGGYVFAEGFHATSAGRTVTRRSGELVVQDGVAATSGPVVAGFIVVDVDSIEAAQAWAEKVPTANYGSVDIRPVVEWNG
ncbi:YciI family protein [Kribbella sandramycini]|uniref:YciI family protein n=1 Tax=Kribbella sandramycini TaxID=60450 RepID=A0A7Y4NXL6_9ACTN|nr:YciI family protein [Kribbella sandramycini]MBB6567814.1 hypothetical protein [Kribbella sandramycini]NOL39591.1 YciI family protein [Kribbella sandramycini]